VRGAQFSPDGTRIVTASEDKIARVWDTATGKTLATLTGHEEAVYGVQFSPDGMRIVTASMDKTARVWDTATGKALALLAGHEGMVNSAQFSPDGSRIATVSQDKTARLWDALTPKAGPPPDWFPDFLRYMAQMRLNPDGALETLKAADWFALRERLDDLASSHGWF
jgi:WD40 repeat protein